MKKKLLTLITILFLFPIATKAANVSLDCPATAKKGGEVKCDIKVSSDTDIGGFRTAISTSESLTYQSYSKAENWDGTSSATKFLIYGKTAKGNLTLGTYTYKVSNTADGNLTVTLSDIVVSNANGDKIESNNTTTKNIRVLSDTNTLSSLTVDGATINFSSSTTTYSATVNADKTNIKATATDSNSKVEGLGEKQLNYGENKFEIIVTSETGIKKTYTITINRPDSRSKENNLSALALSNGEINFEENKTTYEINIDASTTAITATAKDSKAKVEGIGVKDLQYGVNKFEIVVTAENGSKKTYTINVNRKDNRDGDHYLSELSVSVGEKIEFNKYKIYYTVMVSNDVTEATITAKAKSEKSKVEGAGLKQLNEGENIFKIKVTAENQSTKEYEVKIIREKKETVTANNNIKSLVIKDYNINFDTNTKEYKLETELDKLDITVELENSESKYEIIGNEELHDGSIIQIIVTDKEGNNNTYKILISNKKEIEEEKEEESKTETSSGEKQEVEEQLEEKPINYVPIIAIGVFIILLIITIILFIKRKKEKSLEVLQ